MPRQLSEVPALLYVVFDTTCISIVTSIPGFTSANFPTTAQFQASHPLTSLAFHMLKMAHAEASDLLKTSLASSTRFRVRGDCIAATSGSTWSQSIGILQLAFQMRPSFQRSAFDRSVSIFQFLKDSKKKIIFSGFEHVPFR